MNYSKAEEATADFAKTIADLDLALAKLHKSSLRGFEAPNLQAVTQVFRQLKQIAAINEDLTESQSQQLELVQRYISLENKSVQAQELISNEVERQSKEKERLFGVESRLERLEQERLEKQIKQYEADVERRRKSAEQQDKQMWREIEQYENQLERTKRLEELEERRAQKEVERLERIEAQKKRQADAELERQINLYYKKQEQERRAKEQEERQINREVEQYENELARIAKMEAAEKERLKRVEETEIKSLENAYAKIPALQAEAAQMQRKIRQYNLETTEIGKQIALLREKSNQLEHNRTSGEAITAEVQLQTMELEKQLKVAKHQMNTLLADQPGIQGKSESFWERRFGWFVAGSVFYGTMRAAKDMVSTATSIESSMNLIQRISSDTTADFVQMRDELLNLGVQYGQTWDVVSTVAEGWARTGKSVSDTLQLTEASLIGLNTSTLTSTQLVEGLVAILAQWGMESDQVIPLLDKVTMAADNFSTTSGDLIQGLQRSSSAAKAWNMTIEETIAFMTVLQESTGRTGNEIGNVMNTLLAFMKRAETIKAFQAVGIDIYTDSSQTQYRNIMDVFADLSVKMGHSTPQMTNLLLEAAEAAGLFTEEVAELTDTMDLLSLAQEQSISTAAAGTRRQNYLIAVLERWAVTDEVLLKLEDALGYSMYSNERAMDTYAKRVEQFRASWQQLATTFMESGILELLSGFAQHGTAVLQFFNELDRPMKAVVGTLVTFAAALTAVNMAMKTFGVGGLASAMQSTAKQTIGFLPAAQASLMGGIGAPHVAAVGLGLAGIAGIVSMIRQQKEYNEQLKSMTNLYVDATRKVEDLGAKVSEYMSADEFSTDAERGLENYNKALSEQQEVMNELGGKFPELVLQVDEFGNVAELAIEPMKGVSEQMMIAAEKTENLETKLHNAKIRFEEMVSAFNKGIQFPDYEPPPNLATSTFNQYVAYGIRPEEARKMVIEDLGVDPYETGTPAPDKAKQYAAIEAERERIAEIEKEVARRVERSSPVSSGGRGGPAFDLSNWRKQFLMLEDPSIEIALTNLRRDLRLLALEEDNLAESLLDESRAKEFAAERSRLLARENELLAASNGQLYTKVAMYQKAQAEANAVLSNSSDAESRANAIQALNEANSQITSLTSKIADNTIKIRENDFAILNGTESLKKYFAAQKQLQDESFGARKTFFQHEVDMGRANRDTQIKFWRDMLRVYSADAEKRMEIEKRLQALYKSGLEEQMRLTEKAYKERLKQIDDEADARIKSIQREIDAIDSADEDSTREEAARQHADKLQEIEEQIHYHSLRTGKEHEKAIADLQKQYTEEQHRWTLQQEKWAREDRKSVLNQKIDDIKENSARQKEELQSAWEETRDLFQSEVSLLLATASVYDETWYEKGLDWITQLAQGMRTGAGAIDSLLSDIMMGTGGMGDSDLKARSSALLDAKRAWERAFAAGDTEAMRRAAEAGAAIRASGPTLDPNNDLSGDQLEDAIRRATFHTGGLNLREGWAYLAERENVTTATLNARLDRFLDQWDRGVTHSITYRIDKMVSIQNANFNDRADMQSLASIISRRMEILNTARGRG